MYCVTCGSALREGAKFCGNCGGRVEAAAAAGPKLVQLADLPGNLPRCKVSIREVTAEDPDDDGDVGVNVQYVVQNDSGEDWEYLSARTMLLDSSGQIIDETYDTTEQTMPAGEEVEMEAWMGGINAALFAGKAANGQVVVHVVASRLQRQKLGSFAIPAEPYSVVPLKPCTIGDTVKIISGSLWRTPPDSDKDCRVVLKLLCQNLTEAWLPAVKVEAKLTDKMDRDIETLDQSEEIRPGAIATIDCSTYLKANKLAGSTTATVAVNVFVPITNGLSESATIIFPPKSAAVSSNCVETQASPANSPTSDAIDGQAAIFKFTRTIGFELDDDELSQFISSLGLRSAVELEELANSVATGTRDEDSEKAYASIDRKLLKKLRFDVFFDNFSNAEAIFIDPKASCCTIEEPSPEFQDAKILYLAEWESDREDKAKRVEITIEAKYRFLIQSEISIDQPDEIEDEELQDQIRECRNMFNFSVENFEYDDDETFEHEWAVELE